MSYIGVPPFGQTVRTITELTASAGQTTFNVSGGYLPGYVDVFLNGVSLASGDFTSTNGSTVVLGAAASLNDEFKAIAYWPVSLTDTYRKSEVDALLATKQAASPTLTTYASTGIGFRNRIINGDMRIDQRNAGAAGTASSSNNPYFLDRFRSYVSGSGTFSIQRTTDAPTGFTNSMTLTTVNAVTPGASDAYVMIQPIEGYNVADFMFGTASATTVTISFWAKASITGTYAFVLSNFNNRVYVANYTINSANTWEYKTVAIAGDTTGTWPTDNSAGMSLTFDLGSGSSTNVTPNTWLSSGRTTAGAVRMISTAGATLKITGVQLEAGSVASPFERRDYGRELMMAQRYFYKVSYASKGLPPFIRITPSNNEYNGTVVYPVAMRASPTISTTSTQFHKPGIRSDSFTLSSTAVDNQQTVIEISPATNDTSSYVGFLRDGSFSASSEL